MQRIKYLDGLRGVSCLQVVFMHYGAPFGFFADGRIAVAVFFLLSGYVLTVGLEQTSYNVLAAASARFLRLSLPGIASILLTAAAFYVLRPDIKQTMTGTLLFCFHQLTFQAPRLQGMSASLNPPLWTLVVEIWGSFLTLALVRMRRAPWPAYVFAIFSIICLLGTNELTLFVIGHLASLIFRRASVAAFIDCHPIWIPGTSLIVLGAWISSLGVETTFTIPTIASRFESICWPQAELGAICVFFGILMSAPLQRLLSLQAFQHLGKISFSVYLLHAPLISTLGFGIFITSRHWLTVGDSMILTICLGTAGTLYVAERFDRYVDEPVRRGCRRLSLRSFRWKKPSVTAAAEG